MFFIVKYLELRNKSYICNNDSVANDYRFVAEGGVRNHSSDFLYKSLKLSFSFSQISDI